MLALRWLNGPQPGQVFPLKTGTMILGRESGCDIQIKDRGISKQHVRLQVTEDKVIITDLDSTNGTFVNGIKIQHHRLQPGDKIMFHNLIFELAQNLSTMTNSAIPLHTTPISSPVAPSAQWHGNTAMQMEAYSEPQENPQPATKISVQSITDLWNFLQTYLETVALPGVYRLAEMFEFKYVIAGFFAVFVASVTILSSIPMIQITRRSVENESRRRALTLARYVESRNREALAQNLESALDVNLPREEGVRASLIVDAKDGHIIAPASRLGGYENSTFIQSARSRDSEFTEQIDGATIGASVPIKFYNPEQGAQTVSAYAIVIYDMGSLAVDDGRVISLFMETFIIALIVGGIVFFFTNKMIERPLVELNDHLDTALREQRSDLSTSLRFPILQRLYSNINSALSRSGQTGDGSAASHIPQILSTNIANLLQMTDHAALALHGSDEVIVGATPQFETLTGVSLATIQGQKLTAITDQALQLNLADLLARCRQEPNAPASDSLEFGGQNYHVICQAMPLGSSIAFYLIVIRPTDQGAFG